MNIKKLLAFSAMLLGTYPVWTQKKVLDHSVYDDWKSIATPQITADGSTISFVVEPQEGDGKLVIRKLKNSHEIIIDRGYKFRFTPDGKYAVCLIKPFWRETRTAKIRKEKFFPQDSLAVVDLQKEQVCKFAAVKSYKMGEQNAPYVAFASTDTALIPKQERKDRKMGRPVLLYRFATARVDTLFYVKDYLFNEQGNRLAAVVMPHKKTGQANSVNVYELPSLTPVVLSDKMEFYSLPSFDTSGTRLSFLASPDTASTGSKRCALYLHTQGNKRAKMLVDHTGHPAAMPSGWAISKHGTPRFSENGKRIFVGIAPVVPPKDTSLVDFETAALDVWHYADSELQPMQLIHKPRELKKTYISYIDLNDNGKLIPLTTERWETIYPLDRGNSRYAIALNEAPYKVEADWEGAGQKDICIIDLEKRTRRKVAKRVWSNVYPSPDGKYVLWFGSDKQWYCHNMANNESVCLTDKTGVSFAQEDFDRPMFVPPYGLAGWTKDDKEVLLYDRYDIWKFVPDGTSAVNLTQGKGRKENHTYRYLNTKEKTAWQKDAILPQETLLLSIFDEITKKTVMLPSEWIKQMHR